MVENDITMLAFLVITVVLITLAAKSLDNR